MLNPECYCLQGNFLPCGYDLYLNSRGKTRNADPLHRIKRPMNSFMAWSVPARKQLGKLHPHATNTEKSVMLGKIWKNLSPGKREEFQQQAQKLKAEHQKKYPDYKYQPRRKNRVQYLPSPMDIPTVYHFYPVTIPQSFSPMPRSPSDLSPDPVDFNPMDGPVFNFDQPSPMDRFEDINTEQFHELMVSQPSDNDIFDLITPDLLEEKLDDNVATRSISATSSFPDHDEFPKTPSMGWQLNDFN